jgi:outer membrane protein
MTQRRFLYPLFAAIVALAYGGVPHGACAQKLVNAPSTVMLANNIQAQNADASAIAAQTPAARPMEIPTEKALKQSSEASLVTAIPDRLTIGEAEQIAIRNNPRVRVAQLLARAQHQVYRETRAAYLPQLEAGAVAADADSGSRFTFDGLRSARLLTHVGGGLDFHQLLTDFGRTTNLMASSKLREKAQNEDALASQLDVTLITDQAFYNALEAKALVKLAQQTVDTRTTTDQQIAELTKNKLRSDIDLAFSEQNVAQANLLLLDAQTQYNSAINALTAVLGFDHAMQFQPVDDGKALTLPPPDQDTLVQMALKQRPDLMALDYEQQADKKYSRAEWEQKLPSFSAMGVVGGTPIRDDKYFTSNWFGSVGANIAVPIFNGFLFSSETDEANDRARATQQNLRDLRNRVVRDVRDAWMQTNTSYQKIAVTQKFLQAANLGLRLSQARYKLGLSSIVELSQSQLAQTQASIEYVNAKFAYQLSLAALNYQLGNLP